jgi:NAD(P)-dependent dehydrogenase (short-subunit alcohol dehydrogenase family)
MSHRVVVVTGASAGVGRATALAFGRRGASVGMIARGEERLEAARREIEEAGGRAETVAADVADARAIEEAATRIESALGPIDVWVNNAMVTVFAPFEQTEPDEFRRATEVTYLGSVWGTMAALRRMKPRDRGVIVQVGSALAYRGIPLQAAYCGAKHALQGFLESLRTELRHEGSNVRLTMVQLPAVNTPQFTWSRVKMPHQPQPVPPIFQPEVAADAIVFAADHPRREVMVGWPTVKAILGNAVAPGIADRYLADNGYQSQQTDVPLEHERLGNLFEPVDGDRGAHGPFDDRAKGFSLQLWATKHRVALGAAAGAAALTTAAITAATGGKK